MDDLESKIIDLSIQLRNKKNEVHSVYESHGKLIRKLTHNLKNPVGLIVSFSEMILEDIEQYDKKKLKRYISIIKDSADYSIQFLNKTSKFSRLQSPKVTFLFKKLNFIDVLDQVISELECYAKENKIKIKKDFCRSDLMLLIDAEELSYALSSIIHNSIRFSPENSTIVVSVRDYDNYVNIIITDEGMGVSKLDIEEIFKEFYVVNTAVNNTGRCIGLGLTISKKIIEQHKGTILFTSILNQGSSVKIMLPKITKHSK